MKHEQFLLTHPVQDKNTAGLTNEIWKMCLSAEPTSKKPDLGPHITLLPPFRAIINDVKIFSIGLNIARAMFASENGRGNRINYSEIKDLQFFSNGKKDVLVFNVAFPRQYVELIESYRRELPRFAEWVNKPCGEEVVFNPSISIAEGKYLYNELLLRYLTRSFKDYVMQSPIGRNCLLIYPTFPEIRIRKNNGVKTTWELFIP